MENKIKILTIFGTRPEAVKLAPVIRKIEEYPDRFTSVVCVTAQHREMLDQVLDLFKIVPAYDLDIMKPNQNLFDVTCNSLAGVRDVLEKERPNLVLVQGDTTTTFAASLAAFYEKIPVGHIEAGLRTHKQYSPYPEEMNRRLTSQLASLHFSPTERAMQNLVKEGVPIDRIFVTGNSVIDALFFIKKKFLQDQNFFNTLENKFSFLAKSKRLVLVTGHRRENFGSGMENICKALLEISGRDDVELLYPVHLNPNVQEPVKRILGNRPNIHLVEPVGYVPFVYLINRAFLIISDSGGIQEEAPSLGKPVLVTRKSTERPEGLEAGTAKLVGTDSELIVQNAFMLLDDQLKYKRMAKVRNPYGDGRTAERIAEILRINYEPDRI